MENSFEDWVWVEEKVASVIEAALLAVKTEHELLALELRAAIDRVRQ